MPQTFDLVLKGGVVVNQDGRGERDVGVNGGARSPPSATCRRPRPARCSTPRACTSCRASSTRQVHFREPGLE